MKQKIAYLLSGRYSSKYQKNLEYINENRYICIDKVPIKILLEGILQAIPESSISLIKEVILEALQFNGIEQTFSDEDWDKLNAIPYMKQVDNLSEEVHKQLVAKNLEGVDFKPFVKDESYEIDKNLFSNLLDEFDAENLKDNTSKKRVEIKLKNPKECEYFKEVGCIKDICTCYTLLDINLNE